jgi:Uma2 family endonuclease
VGANPDPPRDEPEPAIAVLRGQSVDYRDHHPGPADVGLVVEVAHRYVRRAEQRRLLYSAAGIPQYWIVNLINRAVQVHTKPPEGPLGHNDAEILPYRPGAEIELRLDGKLAGLVSLADLFPPREEPEGGG